jgi:hypothetical protein
VIMKTKKKKNLFSNINKATKAETEENVHTTSF